jgi:hypothetical protein
MKQIAAVETGAYLNIQGINLGKAMAESLAAIAGYDSAKIQTAAGQVGQFEAQGILDARFGETDAADLQTGLSAAFGQDARDIQKIQEQQDQRAASGQGTSLGTGGLGTAEH